MARSILLALLLAVAASTALQAQEVGTGPLTILPSVAEGYEEFKKQPDRSFFAVSKDGNVYGYSFCEHFGGCVQWGGRRAATQACERGSGGVPCYIYANMNGVLWKGEVTVSKDDCSTAFESEEWEKAYRECGRLAEQGYRLAQLYLGVMYTKGQGVSKNYVQAHKWFSVTAARLPTGESRDKVVEIYDNLAKAMSTAEVAEAEKLAQQWLGKNKKAN